ncbi:hypothetical protein DFJ73DRAFT_799041 [Zopfochytrium polystomum]|nr:hypothetical protein DFJ73DRAFT_799041 [Zopfochytrium polystomum]
MLGVLASKALASSPSSPSPSSSSSSSYSSYSSSPTTGARLLFLFPAAAARRSRRSAVVALAAALVIATLLALIWSRDHHHHHQQPQQLLTHDRDPNDRDPAPPPPPAPSPAPSPNPGGTPAIPRLIHQTWKTANRTLIEPVRLAWLDSWTSLNPSHTHILWTDASADAFVLARFPGRVHEAYARLPQRVQKTDLFRYLVLLADGGVYADADTVCLRPVDGWVAAVLGEGNDGNDGGVRFVAGLEWDTDRKTEGVQLCQWVMAAAPGYPAVREAVERVVERIEAASDAQLGSVDEGVVGVTGPVPWTAAVTAYLERGGGGGDGNGGWDLQAECARRGGLRTGGVRLGDVAVLGITSFSPYHAHAGGVDHPHALVEHKFAGVWGGGWKGNE